MLKSSKLFFSFVKFFIGACLSMFVIIKVFFRLFFSGSCFITLRNKFSLKFFENIHNSLNSDYLWFWLPINGFFLLLLLPINKKSCFDFIVSVSNIFDIVHSKNVTSCTWLCHYFTTATQHSTWLFLVQTEINL